MRGAGQALSALLLAGVVALGGLRHTIAQEATPAADAVMAIDGVSVEPLAFIEQVAVTNPLDFSFARITFAPGSRWRKAPADPALGMLVVESGTITLELDGPVTINRADTLAIAMTTMHLTGDPRGMMEVAVPGQPVTLEEGDAVFIPGQAGGEIRNDGYMPAVALSFRAIPVIDATDAATPAP
jgi:quercetin dioxygenase-like cupin family protein